MTDKQFNRANEIKDLIKNLEWLKRVLETERLVQFAMEPIKMIKDDFIDVVESKIAQLQAEYKKL